MTPSRPATLEYAASPPPPLDAIASEEVRRFSVYGLDESAQRMVRVRVDAAGLGNLYAQLHRANVLGTLVIDDPGPHDEAPPLSHWAEDADQAPPEIRRRLDALHAEPDVYTPLPPIRLNRRSEQASPTPRLLLRLPGGYLQARRIPPSARHAYRDMMIWSLITGALHLLSFLVVVVFARMLAGAGAPLAIGFALVFYLLPAAMLITMGLLTHGRRQTWMAIVILVVAALGLLAPLASMWELFNQTVPSASSLFFCLLVISAHATLIGQCIRALRSR